MHTVAAREEWLVPFPLLAITRRVRGTLLAASRHQLRAMGSFDAYQERLPASARRDLDALIAASWVPVELAHVHFAAIDALGIPDSVVLENARQVAERMHQVFLSTALHLIRGAGVTPWSTLPIVSKLWSKLFDGGGVGVKKLGPKDAHVVVTAHPLLRYRYHRVGLRTHVGLVVKSCATRTHIRELDYDASTHARG